MKIFNTQQIKMCEKYTIVNDHISYIDLMEKASMECFKWIQENFSQEKEIYIFCGTGNNGGDGLALTRILIEKNYKAQAYICNTTESFTEEALVNYNKLKDKHKFFVTLIEEDQIPTVENSDILIVDAIFGIGLDRPLEGVAESVVKYLNTLQNRKISIDIPSGLYNNNNNKLLQETVFKADDTLSFQFYKEIFLHQEGALFTGNIHILNIGLNEKFIEEEKTDLYIITEDYVKERLKKRNPFANKGDFGKAVIIGGSYGRIGALSLSVKSALRTGCGLLYSLAPACGYEILQTSVPEAMFIEGGDKFINKIDVSELEDFTVGIGPGLGVDNETKKAFEIFLSNYDKPLVIDADALNLISQNKKLLEKIPEKSIITPHAKEFEKLFGQTTNTLEQYQLAKEQAVKYKIVIVMKGHITAIITPAGECIYNMTGNSGMAKGGSGDVLTGIITGLLAQGYTPEEAAVFGVFIHGKAGDLAAQELSQEAMTPQDIIEHLSKIYINLSASKLNG